MLRAFVFRQSYTQWLERQTEGIAETITDRAIIPKISTFIKILSPRICCDYRILSYTLGKLQNRQRNMFNVLLTVHHAMILGNCPT